MDFEEIHGLVHRDPKAAWPHVVQFIEGGRAQHEHLLEDIISSDALTDLIDDIQAAFHRNTRFQKALLWCGDSLGGCGGPEMSRIYQLIDIAEQRHAFITEVDSMEPAPHLTLREWVAALRGKIVGHRLRGERRDRGRPPT